MNIPTISDITRMDFKRIYMIRYIIYQNRDYLLNLISFCEIIEISEMIIIYNEKDENERFNI